MRDRLPTACLTLCLALLAAPPGNAQDAGVTDLTRADTQAIAVTDIVEALAVPRGTSIEPSAPPTLRLPVYFEFNSATLTPEARDLLTKVGSALIAEELAPFAFSVEGHTDSVGSSDYNAVLSEARATAVKDFLIARGVPAPRVRSSGKGEEAPVASNDTEEGRQRNRRVEVINLGATP